MTITVDTVFYTQVGSIVGFIVALFAVYRLLVAQKQAEIEVWKARNSLLETKISNLESEQPDVLIERLKSRAEALEQELVEAEKHSAGEKAKILDLEVRLHVASKQINTLDDSMERARRSVVRFRRSSTYARAALIEYYGGRCQICGANAAPELCHIRPRSKGGSDSLSNFLLLCAIHHSEFDRGKIKIGEDGSILGTPTKMEIHPDHKPHLSGLA